MISAPLIPLPPQAFAEALVAVHSAPPDTEARSRGLAVLWLHFCHLAGHSPSEAAKPDTPAFRRVRDTWTPEAANASLTPSWTLSTKLAPIIARKAVLLFEEALRQRGQALGGQVPALLEITA